MRLIYSVALTLLVLLVPSLTGCAKEKAPSYNFSRGMDEAMQGNVEEAFEYFNKELEENPQNGYAHMAVAKLYMDYSQYGDARNSVEAAIKYIPKKHKGTLARAYVLRGQLFAIECDTVAAYSDLATAIRLDPDYEDAYEKRGQLLYEQQRYDEADADYRKLLSLNPGG